jgi:hypothetical protein
MSNMQILRNAHFLARFVLVWFALFIGVATATPLVQPGNLQMICSASGAMKLIDADQPDGEPRLSAAMDCPLCASVALPPPLARDGLVMVSPLAHALKPVVAAHIAAATAPPLPSRGPPVHA